MVGSGLCSQDFTVQDLLCPPQAHVRVVRSCNCCFGQAVRLPQGQTPAQHLVFATLALFPAHALKPAAILD